MLATHVCKAVSFNLYNIRRIRKYLTKNTTQTLDHAIIMGRIDYCNSLLFGLPAVHVNKLHRIQNSAARLVCSIPRFDPITPDYIHICYTGYLYRLE